MSSTYGPLNFYIAALLMPKESKREKLENRLISQGKKKGLSGSRLKAYVYGTLDKVIPKKSHKKIKEK